MDVYLRNNLTGIELEKQGNLEEAIKLYEENVSGRFIGNHPYDRLAVIYRKQKDRENEQRILETAIDVFTNDVSVKRHDRIPKLQKFKYRLIKLDEIIMKENKKTN